MKRYEYAHLTYYPWPTPKSAKPGEFYYDDEGKKGKPSLVMLNELGAQGWRVIIRPHFNDSTDYLLERELPN